MVHKEFPGLSAKQESYNTIYTLVAEINSGNCDYLSRLWVLIKLVGT